MKLNQHHHSKAKKNHLGKNAFSKKKKKKNKKHLDQKSKRLNYIKYSLYI